MNIKIEPNEIIDRLCSAGFEAFIVGGYVRDTILGKKSSDIDIATSASSDDIEQLFQDRNIKSCGNSFLVTYVDDIEVATYRKDTYHGGNAKNCTVTKAETLLDDLVRRDLTMNAMAMCHKTGDIIDPYNGKQDARNKSIQFVGDPVQTIIDDPARVLRACRFLAIFEGEFTPGTFKAMKEYGHLVIENVPANRIHDEIMKTMKKAKFASLFFESLHSIGLLQYIFPSLADCCGHPHGNHHIEDIFEHSMLVGDYISCKFPLLKLAAYLHDIGKPKTYNTVTHQFITHEKEGEVLASNELKNLKFSNNEIKYVTSIIRTHMYALKEAGHRGIRRLNKKLFDHKIPPTDWLRIRIADHQGNIKNDAATLSEIKKQYKKLFSIDTKDTQITVRNLAISGGDIIRIFGIRPGPKVGEIQRELLSRVIDGDIKNNEADLILFIQKIGVN